MNRTTKSRAQTLLQLRAHHPAWQLLTARSGPSIIATLKQLFDEQLQGIDLDQAHQVLAEVLQLAHEAGEIDSEGDYLAEARRELRGCIKRGLLVERDGRVLATDALQAAFRFVDSLDSRIMTSTASRLALVQREIETLESSLNPDPEQRARDLEKRIEALQQELEAARRGEVQVLPERQAREAIRELYGLAMSLRHDFRRVEDSYREADRRLRQSIIGEERHRGEIVDSLLDSHDALLATEEGQVFDNFQRQLAQQVELEQMHQRIRRLVKRPVARAALSIEQQVEMSHLKYRLVVESRVVIDARSRGERDVRGFLKTGLAAEHHRVGQLLNAILAEAGRLDWQPQALRRADAPLPPVGIGNPSLPLLERLRFKELQDAQDPQLDLLEQSADLADLEDDFWSVYDALDRQQLIERTRALLDARGEALSIATLADELQPEHDLEALALWLTLALEAERPLGGEEQVALTDADGHHHLFTLPQVTLDPAALTDIQLEI